MPLGHTPHMVWWGIHQISLIVWLGNWTKNKKVRSCDTYPDFDFHILVCMRSGVPELAGLNVNFAYELWPLVFKLNDVKREYIIFKSFFTLIFHYEGETIAFILIET